MEDPFKNISTSHIIVGPQNISILQNSILKNISTSHIIVGPQNISILQNSILKNISTSHIIVGPQPKSNGRHIEGVGDEVDYVPHIAHLHWKYNNQREYKDKNR